MSRADDIQKEQSELQRELEAIQGEWQHKKHHIKFNYNTKTHMWKCDTCNLYFRYPSKKELDKFLNS